MTNDDIYKHKDTHYSMSFSIKLRWSKKRREGTLVEAIPYDEEEAVELDEVVEDESEEYVSNLKEAAADLIHSLQITQWVVVFYEGEWYPGEVQKVDIVDSIL